MMVRSLLVERTRRIAHSCGALVGQSHTPAFFYAAVLGAALALHLASLAVTRHDVHVQTDCAENGELRPLLPGNKHTAAIDCPRPDYVASFPAGVGRIQLTLSEGSSSNGRKLQLLGIHGETAPVAGFAPGEHQLRQTVIVPSSIGRWPFTLVASGATGGQHNLPFVVGGYSEMAADLNALALALAAMAVLHFIALELSAIALRFNAGPAASCWMLLLLGMASMGAFWLCYLSRTAGIAFCIVFLGGLALHALVRLLKADEAISQNLPALHAAIAPVSSLVILLFILGFYPFPEHWANWQFAATRWRNLPIDNWLPKIFADQIWSGHVRHPMLGSWLSSDRPPLQTGFHLLLRPLARGNNAAAELYQLGSMWLQATFLIPLAWILRRFSFDRFRALTILVLSTSALVIYNGVFVWPKLIAATFCLISYVALFIDVAGTRRFIAAGAAAALAMLSHGGAIFALVPIFLVFCLRAEPRKWRGICIAALVALVVYAPWMYYQKFVDPPGTRLIAYHLAGVERPSPLPVADVVRGAYAQLTLGEWWHARLSNLKAIANGSWQFFRDVIRLGDSNAPTSWHTVVVGSFFYFAYAQWFLSPLLAAVCAVFGWARVRRQSAALAPLLATICIGLALWALLMFRPGSTVIHQGAYFLNLASMLAVAAIVYSCSRALYAGLCFGNLAVFILAFALSDRAIAESNPPLPGFLASASSHPYDAMYFCLLALAMLAHWWLSRDPVPVEFSRASHAAPSRMNSLPADDLEQA